MRELAEKLLQQWGGAYTDQDVTTLADDLLKVSYNPKMDRGGNVCLERIFVSRIGGIGALGRYMSSIRPRDR